MILKTVNLIPNLWRACELATHISLSFRSKPTESLERVLEAAARAATTMPSLRAFSVILWVADCPRNNGEQPFELGYRATGATHWPDTESLLKPKLRWCAPSDWSISASLEKIWRAVLGSEGELTYDGW